ncbi:MAG: SDR family oxidoreductase [Gammaproteobacteria bacterium]|nr:SDR family oxidoreductase [Gammaproteobacteria bacterium]MDH3538330.1 SDR family oxidoreductase [Gammaproteobacteria bacterium]
MQKQKVILVTGANRGMGLETCRELVAMGHRVLLGGRDRDAATRAAQSLASDLVEAVRLDVTSPSDIDALARHIDQQYGRLDVLVNNAGIMIDGDDGHSPSICAADIDAVERTLRVNTLGPMMVINAMLPLMQRVDDARIINISSGMGQLSDMGGNYPGYRLSKTALNALTRIYAAELDPARFKVNAVCPGWVRTDMGGSNAELSLEAGVDTAIWLATSDDATGSGGLYRKREPIDW